MSVFQQPPTPRAPVRAASSPTPAAPAPSPTASDKSGAVVTLGIPDAPVLCPLETCTVLGGSGYDLIAGRDASVRFRTDGIVISGDAAAADQRITYPEVIDVQIDGPGSVRRGGGFIGGGFGVTGALEGIAIASILNALTTKTTIHTFVQITTDTGEIFLHYGYLEPGALRIALSAVFTYLRKLDAGYISSRMRHLEALRDRGVIDQDELSRLSAQVLDLDGLDRAVPTASKVAYCPRCQAEFMVGVHCLCGWL